MSSMTTGRPESRVAPGDWRGNRGVDGRSSGPSWGLLVTGLVVVGLGALAAYYLVPDLKRYMKIRNMEVGVRGSAMHELSIALAILDIAAEQAEGELAKCAGRVVAIHLKLGPLSGVVKEALLLAYELAREGTPLEQARLQIEEVPLAAWCPACAGERAPVSMQELCCPVCGEPTPQVVRGRELEVVALEIES